MRIVCSYCQRDLGEREPLDNPGVSHGMCAACHAHYRRQWSGLSLGEYLDDFPGPVLVVDEDVRMVAVNQPMADLLGRPREELFGLKGGEALECVHARQPNGCGGTVHCRTCAIRNSVGATFETGAPCVRVPASVERDTGRTDVLISTAKRGSVVQVVIEQVAGAPTASDDPPPRARSRPGADDSKPPRGR